MKTFARTLKHHRVKYAWFVLFYIVASVVISASFVVAQILTGEIGQSAYEADTSLIFSFLVLLTAVMGARAVFSSLSALMMGRFAGTAGHRFRTNFIRFFLRRPFAKMETANSGEMLSVFTNDLPLAVRTVQNGILEIVSDTILLAASLAYMFYMNWTLTIIYIAFFPVLAVIQVLISMPLEKLSKKVMEATAGFNAVVYDSLQNPATVISYSLEDELESRYLAKYMGYFDAHLRQVRFICVFVILGFVSSALPLVYLFIASGFAVVNDAMQISGFIVFTGIGMLAAEWLLGLSQNLGYLGVASAGAKRLIETTTGDGEALGKAQNLEPGGRLALSFDGVSFSYREDAPDALQNVSFEIPHGAKVAFVGGSGSGKSTVLKLMLGLYEPKSGKISVLGQDVSETGKHALREAFAYVPQDSFLFPVSIGENIAGKKGLSEEEMAKLEKACKDAGILEFIKSLRDGFESVLSESAENISGGQRQRIAMARAFYKDAPILLFDEATSALDPTTEAEILKSLEVATKGKTLIMVAHRASAKSFCDTAITLEGGKIA